MERDAGDMLDRYSIAILKSKRIGSEENRKEVTAFCTGFYHLAEKHPDYNWQQFLDFMIDINDFIWQLESGLKSGKEELKNPNYILDKENKDALSNIGATTILIRNFNHLRVSFKNMVNTLVKEGFIDKKCNHLSEGESREYPSNKT